MSNERGPLDGCQDGNCKIVDNRHGQHTNGGCRCLRYVESYQPFRDALAKLKSEHAKLVEVAREAARFARGDDSAGKLAALLDELDDPKLHYTL